MGSNCLLDGTGRRINYLRISVTDRCNLRCIYCMPEEGIPPVPHSDILSYEEITYIAALCAQLGVAHIRLTGGEPLVRPHLASLVALLKGIPGIETVSITTNGILLKDQLPGLLAAGLDGVNLSLDTLDASLFEKITRRPGLNAVLEALEAVLSEPSLKLKVNCVPTAENLSQLAPLAGLARDKKLDVRFIELMPIGLGSAIPHPDEAAVRGILEKAYGPLSPCHHAVGNGPCSYFSLPGFTGKIGFISALSHQFCAQCNRVRLTSTGFFKPCLQYEQGTDLRPLLHEEDKKITSAILSEIQRKPAHHHFTGPAATGDEGACMSQIGG
ncbi:MAG: GTP 3',8-cyclase MoaA [Oscillospiraceae bacterium]